jgi:H2-forming N5,N10-methylenetetrahydromethanopterin dehydrogenase-like enzyme
MRTTVDQKSKGKIKWTEEEIKAKTSWTDLIDKETWDAILSKINLSGEYPKGTQTAVKHITYSAYINKVVETIRIDAKPRFRTDTEIFRISVHLGITLLYKIFCSLSDNKDIKDSVKNSRGYFFYQALEDLNKKIERAGMVAMVKEKSMELEELVKKHNMTYEESQENMDILLNALDRSDEKYVRSFLGTDRKDNVTNINESFLKRLMNSK